MRHEAAGITTGNFPPTLKLGANEFRLEYHFEPGAARDGVTMTVPVALLNQVSAARTDWLVPGLLKEKVQTLAKSIPQRLRHKLGPLADFAESFVAAAKPSDVPLTTAIARHIRAELNLDIPQDAFRPDSAPPHLAMNYLVVDEHGRQLAVGRNLAELKTALREETEAVLQDEAPMPEGREVHRVDVRRSRRNDGARARADTRWSAIRRWSMRATRSRCRSSIRPRTPGKSIAAACGGCFR